MHFENRESAGELLTEKLETYDNKLLYIVALGEGSVPVALKIASSLNADLALFISSEIELPGQGNEVIGSLNQGGQFVYNESMSYSDQQELGTEFRNYIEEQKLEKAHYMNRLVRNGAIVDPHQLQDRMVVLVSDGLETGLIIESVYTLLKPVQLKKLIAAVPVASVKAIDRLHIRVDHIHCLRTVDTIEALERFYDDNSSPDRAEAITIINQYQS